MHIAVTVFLLVSATIGGCVLAKRLGLSAPLLLTAIGAALSYLPHFPDVHVDPEVVLIGFLPPLLYATACKTSLLDLRRDLFQIIQLSVLLVVVTAFAVGLISWFIMPISFAAALALGGIVAPPDAVAATAVARKIGLPRRLVSVLEGESLFNDATALVTVSTATAAMKHTVTPTKVSWDFLLATVGGVAIGIATCYLMAFLQKHIRDTETSVALTFVTPWVAFLPAEAIESSGVIAVVVAGVFLGFKAPYFDTPQARVAGRMNWESIQFVLENMVFLLIGLQVANIISAVNASKLGLGRTTLYAVVVLLAVMAVRPLFVIFTAWLGKVSRRDRHPLSLREAVVGGWAGMRGVVTLAAAFLLPENTPHREALIFIALVVTIGTLVIQGFTLGILATKMQLHAPDPREDALARAQVVQDTVDASTAIMHQALKDDPRLASTPSSVVDALVAQGTGRANLEWERLGNNDTFGPAQQYRILRQKMIGAERDRVLELRNKGHVDHEVIDTIMNQLDVEESMILTAEESEEEMTVSRPLLTPEVRQGGCEHLQLAADSCVAPQSHDGCPQCIAEGQHWVALRMCLTCGFVGCCDSTPGRHSTKHFEETGHPVMRSFEPGEEWRWCYVDSLPG